MLQKITNLINEINLIKENKNKDQDEINLTILKMNNEVKNVNDENKNLLNKICI
jgi:hypothetical protein